MKLDEIITVGIESRAWAAAEAHKHTQDFLEWYKANHENLPVGVKKFLAMTIPAAGSPHVWGLPDK